VATGACPRCGVESRPNARFCGTCGHDLATTETVEKATAGLDRTRLLAAAAIALLLALLAVALLGQRSAMRENEEAVATLAEQVDALQGRLSALDNRMGTLADRVGLAEKRSKGTSALAARVLPSVFSLEVPDGSGAGFAAWRDGSATVLLTAAHVVQGWDEVTVRRGERSWTGQVLEVDETNDLATIRVPRAIGTPLWDDVATTLPRTGTTLVLFGSPLGYEGTVTRGIISRVAYNEIQTDAPANPGSSGGPALTEDGRLVGVVVSGYEGRDINFVVPVRRVCVKLRAC
jgi:S1-C subfamily serine protease